MQAEAAPQSPAELPTQVMDLVPPQRIRRQAEPVPPIGVPQHIPEEEPTLEMPAAGVAVAAPEQLDYEAPTIPVAVAEPQPEESNDQESKPPQVTPAAQPTVPEPVATATPEPRAEPAPQGSSEDDISDQALQAAMKLQLVDTSHAVVAAAADHAEAHLHEQTTQRGVRGFLKRIWHGNIAREYIRQREIQRGREEIVETGNSRMYQDGSQADHEAEEAAIVTKFVEGYVDNGERQDRLSNNEQGQQLEGELRTLINFFAQGAIEIEELTEEKNRVIGRFRDQLHEADRDRGLMMADNVVEVAVTARAAFRHGVAVERISAALSANLGEALTGARTEVQRNRTDRILERLHRSPVGSLVNETTLSAAVGVVASVATLTTKKAVTAAAAVVGMGVGAGVVAGAREHAQIGRERAHHARERATGQDMNPEAGRRRERLEETRYETASASELTDQLAEARAAVDEAQPTSITELSTRISEIETRLNMSVEDGVDLIDYASASSVERERLDLLLSVSEAKVAARRALEAMDETALADAGLERDLDATLESHSEAVRDLLETDISAKDAAFRRLQRNQTLKMAGVGLVAGVTIGTLVQEARSVFSSDLEGVFEGGSDGQERRTMLAGILGHHGGAEHAAVIDPNDGPTSNTEIGKNALLAVHGGAHLEKMADGHHWELIGDDGKPMASNLAINQHGALTEGSRDALAKAGVRFTEDIRQYETSHVEHHSVTRSPHEFLRHHPGQFTHVHRELWYDNNTSGVFDQNELKLWWGGANNTGISEHGNYVFNIQQMAADGSFHGEFSADAQHLMHEGKLSIALSMDKGTQSHVVMVPIDKHGNAIIDKDSWYAKSLFETKDGQAHFRGAYAEVVQHIGKHHGIENIRPLATVVGDNDPHKITDTVSRTVHEHHQHVTTQLYMPEHDNIPVEVPVPLPIYARRGLETIPTSNRERRRPRLPGNPEYAYGLHPEERRLYDEERSPRLLENPRAHLDPDEELAWRREQLQKTPEDAERLKKIDKAIEDSPVLKEVDESTKAIVTIPVGATSEADNIYKTLSLYAQQDPGALNATKFLLHVNWIDGAENDPAKKAAIEKTIAEIERARHDFPQLQIATMQTVWDEDHIEKRRGVIGDVVSDMFDTALMSVERAKREGKQPGAQDVVIIRNDADAQGMGRNYLKNILTAADKNPEADAFTGTMRWETATHSDYPGFAAVSTFREVMHTIASKANVRVPTIGINTVVRASTLAAVGGIRNPNYAGAGSDDLTVGKRIYAARMRRIPEQERAAYANMTTAQRRIVEFAERSYGYGASSVDPGLAAYNPIKFVVGADIDTAGARVLNNYRAGNPMPGAWSGFNNKSRTDVEDGVELLGPEDGTSDIDEIITRVEMNMTAMAERWFTDPAYFRLGLHYTIPEVNESGEKLYSYRVTSEGPIFKFTDAGKAWFGSRVSREGDSLGRRVRRLNYNERQPGDSTPLLNRQPHLLSPTS